MDPATATIVASLGSEFLSAIFRPAQSGPTQAQVLAALERQRQQEATQRAWLIGAGLVGVGILAFVMISKR